MDQESSAAQSSSTEADGSSKILRIALAMRGGSSLALWIGGAVAEVDLLRRLQIDSGYSPAAGTADSENDRAAGYRELLKQAGFDQIEIDIMTGSSAGGLNGILYAVAQRTRQPLRFLGTWVNLGGVWQLMRPWGFKKTASLLQGDDYLGVHLFDEIKTLYSDGFGPVADPRIPPPPERITVDLSATILDGSDSVDADVREGRAYFHFDQDDIPLPSGDVMDALSRIDKFDASHTPWTKYTAAAEEDRAAAVEERAAPAEAKDAAKAGTAPGLAASQPTAATPFDGQEVAAADRPERGTTRALADPRPGALGRLIRLALAARTTASFTGAFEPSEIASQSYEPGQLAKLAAVDMSPNFVAHRTLPFHAIDGGIFDNIPIEKALQEARTRFAIRTADRYVVYLDPDPVDVRSHPAPPPRVVRRLVGATIASLHRLKREESEVLEVGEIQTANETRHLLQGRLQAFAAVLNTREGGSGIDEECEAAYLRFRAEADAADATDLLGQPGSWQLGADPSVGRQQWPNRGPECVAGLPKAFRKKYRDLLTGTGRGPGARLVSEGPKALMEAAYAVLTWVRFVEEIGPRAIPGWPGYQNEIAIHRELVYDAIEWADAMLDQQYANLLRQLADEEVTGPSDEFDCVVVTEWLGSAAHLADAEAKWENLALPVERLGWLGGQIDARCAADPSQDWCNSWQESVWRAALRVWPEPANSSRRVRDLPLLLASAGASAPMSEIGYHRIGGNEVPANLAEFDHLRKASQRAVLQGVLDQSLMSESDEPLYRVLLGRTARPATPEALAVAVEKNADIRRSIVDAPIGATEKLAGNTLTKSTSLNIAGFLDAGWRTNDWWWGRLDAAAGIVRFLDSLRPAANRMSKEDLEAEIACRQREILGDWRQDRVSCQHDGPHPLVEVGNSTLDDLRPAYLVGVASRLLRLATRALSPGLDTLKGFTLGIAFTFLRPLLVLLPLAADLSRAALVLMLLTTAGWLATAAGQTAADMPPGGSAAIGIALIGPAVLVGIAGVITGLRRWKSVLTTLQPRDSADENTGQDTDDDSPEEAKPEDRATQEAQLLCEARRMRKQAIVRSLPGLVCLALAAAIVAWWLCPAGDGSPKAAVLIGWTLVAYTGAMIVTRAALTVPRVRVGTWPAWRRWRPVAFGLAALIVGLVPMAVHLRGLTAQPGMLPVLLGVIAGISSWVMLTGWIQHWCQPVIAAVMGSITAGTIWVTQGWIPTLFGVVKPTLMVLIMILVWANALWWICNFPVYVKTFTRTAWMDPPPAAVETPSRSTVDNRGDRGRTGNTSSPPTTTPSGVKAMAR